MRVKRKGSNASVKKATATAAPSGKVVDFMELLKQSIDTKKRTPAKKSPAAKVAVTRPSKKRA